MSVLIRLQHAFEDLHGDVQVQLLRCQLLQAAAASITLSLGIIPTIRQNP